MKIYPVIMAGGVGARFWPLSRRRRPKQLLTLTSDISLLEETVARLPPLADLTRTFLVCGPSHASPIRRMISGLPKENLIIEPCARNTAPCVGLAALHIARRDKKGIIAMLPADHHIGRLEAFHAALRAAAALAERGDIATIGIRPSRPETGYGYLKVGARLPLQKGGGRSTRARSVERFVEKPDTATARRYLAEGGYLWNSGMFLFRADVILDEIARAMPVLRKKLGVIESDLGTSRYGRTLKRVFPECPSVSIDYGVMEKSRRITVVPAELGWSDVGSFAALAELRKADSSGNVTDGETIMIAAKNNVVLAGAKRLVVVVGEDDLVVVDAGDAVLVCRRDRAQDVRKVVDELERRGRRDLL